jgi:MoxR-like ATPase
VATGGPADGPGIREDREISRIPGSVYEVLAMLSNGDYVGERSLATALYLSLKLGRPLFLEGEAGVGKTEVAKVLARMLGRRLIRLQCYEGLDVASAVYEWDYPRQMIEIRIAEATEGADRERLQRDIFAEEFLIKRPLLQALEPHPDGPPVLLIDELDRTDEPFEAFLLEILSDFQVSIPELGTVRASVPPIVILTSNRTREIHDALKRRCFYHWIDYPTPTREMEILRLKVPGAAAALTRQVVEFVQRLRGLDLFKVPGIAESIDWTRALITLDKAELDATVVDDTLGVILKYEDDVARVKGALAEQTLRAVKAALAEAG